VKADILLRGGTAVTSDGQFRADFAIRDGRIAAVTDGLAPQAHETMDVSGKYVLPGLIDTHVHIRSPGHDEREDFASGTRAAAAGGITVVLEHPISMPAVNSAEILTRRWEKCRNDAYVDYAFFGAAGEENLDNIAALAEAGVVAFKTFLHAAPPGREDEFEGLTATGDGALYEVLRAVANTGRISVIHAESDSMVQYYIDQFCGDGRNDIVAHMDSRPTLNEVVSAAGAVKMSEAAGARLMIAHISGGTVAQHLEEARELGHDVLVETCPHYLFLNRDDARELGPYAKINPPIRPEEERQLLWEAVRRGSVDFVGSDHGPFTRQEKEVGWEDIWSAPAGAAGLETIVPLMLDAVNRDMLTLSDVVRLMSESAAREFGLWPQKGTLEVGTDADITVVDMDQEYTVDRKRMETRARDCALLYDGWRLCGRPAMTIVRGEVVMADGEISGRRGYGGMIKPCK